MASFLAYSHSLKAVLVCGRGLITKGDADIVVDNGRGLGCAVQAVGSSRDEAWALGNIGRERDGLDDSLSAGQIGLICK